MEPSLLWLLSAVGFCLIMAPPVAVSSDQGMMSRARDEEYLARRESGNSVEGEIHDIMEMVPFERVLATAVEYAIGDPQVSKFFHYTTGQNFKYNVKAFQHSHQFRIAAGFAKKYDVNLYTLANKINHILDLPLIKFNRTKRSPGDGVMSLVKDVVEMTPLNDMKHVYLYKLDTNPKFKDFVDNLVSDEARMLAVAVLGSRPFEVTRRDLIQLGIPIDEILNYLADRLTVFLDVHQ